MRLLVFAALWSATVVTHVVAARPSDITSQFNEYRLRHCDAQHSPLACSQALNDANGCLNQASASIKAFHDVRFMLSQGERFETAIRFAADQGDEPDVARAAANAPKDMDAREFSSAVMKYCLKSLP